MAEDRILLTREEAAEQLSMSLTGFKRHVQPHIPCVYIGRRRYFRPRDLREWTDDRACVGGRVA